MLANVMARIRSLWRGIRHGSSVDAEMEEEFRIHRELRTEDLVRAGLSPVLAARQARLEFGIPEQHAIAGRAARGLRALDRLRDRLPRLPDGTELRQAARSLTRARGFLLISAGSLSIGIAMSVTMFGVMDALVQPNIPVRDMDRLVNIWWGRSEWPSAEDDPAFAAFRAIPAFEVITSMRASGDGSNTGTVTASGAAMTRASPTVVAFNLFDVLGAEALYGRLFTAGDSALRGPAIAVISDRLYRKLYGGARPFTPFQLSHDQATFTVIGVTQPRLDRFVTGEIWTPSATPRPATMLVRLRPGVTVAQLNTLLNALNKTLAIDVSRTSRGQRAFHILPTRQGRVNTTPTLGITVASLVVLLIACANIANLQLARGLSRMRDLAVRVAIGASRADVVRLLMLESTIVALAGGIGGLLLTLWCMGLVRATVPAEFARFGFVEPQLNWRIFADGVGLTMFSAIAFGLAPAIRVSRLDVNSILQSRAGTGAVRRSRRQYTALVTLEISAAMALVICAALLVVSVQSIRALEYGYDSREILVLTATVRDSGENQARSEAIALRNAIRSRAGIADASLSFAGRNDSNAVTTDDPDRARARKFLFALDRPTVVDARFFRTLGMHVEGPGFSEYDDGTEAKVVLDSVAARRFFAGANPIGRMIKLGGASSPRPWLPVVGVSNHLRLRGSQNTALAGINPQVWVLGMPASTPNTSGQPGRIPTRPITIHVRPSGDARSAVETVRAVAAGHGREFSLVRLDDRNGRNALERTQRFIANLFVGFGAVGLLLAMVGVYGVVAHSVSQRTREFGVRIAFGATPERLIRLVMREGNVPLLAGLAIGLILARTGEGILTYFIDGFGDARQIAVYAIAPSAMLAAALAATVAPAIRASRTDPVRAIKAD